MLNHLNSRLARLLAAGLTFVTLCVALPSMAQAAPSVTLASAEPAQVVVGQSTPVRFSADITDPNLIAGSINLLRVGLPGTSPTIVGKLHDDGVNGDAIAGDKRYSIEVTLNEPITTQLTYRISAAFKGTLQRVNSNNIVVGIVATLPVGVLLEGASTTLAREALREISPQGADAADIVGNVIMNRLELQIAPDATVGQVNAALQSLGARILSMTPRSVVISVSVPRQQSVVDLTRLAQTLGAMPGIRQAWVARIAHPTVLPFPVNPGLITASQHLLPPRFPAAWNAKLLLEGCLPVPMLVADHFSPSPSPDFANEIRGFSPNTAPAADPTHGYDVTQTLAALFDATPPTGANPFNECIDLRPIQAGDVSVEALIQRIADAFPSEKFILNQSLGIGEATCSEIVPPNLVPTEVACAPDNVQRSLIGALPRARLALKWKQLTHTRWPDFVAVGAAGNEKSDDGAAIYPALGTAAFTLWSNIAGLDPLFSFVQSPLWNPASPFPLFPSLGASSNQAIVLTQDITTLGLHLIEPADNVLTVGSTTALQTSPLLNSPLHLSLSESSFSNGDPDVTAVGEQIVVLCPAGGICTTQGTSFSAPQVAGLATYLWLLSPELRNLPSSVTVQAIKANTLNPAVNLIDAYATVLSLDAAALPNATNAPARKAILDVNDDRTFDERDLREYVARFIDPVSGEEIPEPAARDFGRHDLNGDGFTGGPTKHRFDLDREGSTQFGATVYTQVLQNIGGSVAFNENELTDLQILCYYAFSAMYTGSDVVRGQLLDGKCTRVTVTVSPGSVTQASGATQQFGASVLGSANPNVTWSATGGTITPTGLFTAGPTAGSFRVRATSVADPRGFGEATANVSAATFSGRVTLDVFKSDSFLLITQHTQYDIMVTAEVVNLSDRNNIRNIVITALSGTGSDTITYASNRLFVCSLGVPPIVIGNRPPEGISSGTVTIDIPDRRRIATDGDPTSIVQINAKLLGTRVRNQCENGVWINDSFLANENISIDGTAVVAGDVTEALDFNADFTKDGRRTVITGRLQRSR